MHYKTTYGGGLGDIINQIFRNKTYNSLNELKPEDTCDVILITHNPFAKELFQFHPKASQLNISIPGYWGPAQNAEMYKKHGISLSPDNLPVHPNSQPIFFHSTEDGDMLDSINKLSGKKVVMSAGAGEIERNIPTQLIESISNYLTDKSIFLIPVGKNYNRPQLVGGGFKRPEPTYKENPLIVSLIDKLTIPGTINLVKQADGIIACHSATCLMAWNLRKPNVTLLPRSLGSKHGIAQRQINEWTFGLAYPETQLAFNEDFKLEMLDNLLRGVQ